MKRLVSIVLALVMFVAVIPGFAAGSEISFSDVAAGDYYATAANALVKAEILTGYEDGTFRPDGNITRAEMAAIICRVIGKEEVGSVKTATDFDDVEEESWASGYIKVASDAGIINGDGNGSFRPDDDVTYEEAIKMVVCALGLADDIEANPSDWSKPYIDVAKASGITTSLKGSKGTASTRADVAVMTYNGICATIAAPVASVAAGSYTSKQSVTLTSATNGAVIYYTTDGSEPTTSSTKYTKAISILSTTTLKAVAVLDDVFAGDVTSVEYNVKLSSDGSGGGGGGSSTTKYTVTFDLNYDGATDAPASQSVKKNNYASEPDDPEREGYTFTGWYTDKYGKDAFNFESTKITKNTTIYAAWSINSDETPEDYVPSAIEELFGTDPDKDDTDYDGLSDYVEIYITGTDPTLSDSDGNGINDGDEDTDNDGLTNIEELELGTSLIKADTDFDGLTDYDEVNVYGTDPLNSDTDGDGLLDGDEVALGLDPLNSKSDGATLDSEREIEQEISTDNISATLLDDNAAIPALVVTASGNVNNTTSIEETESDDFSDSRAIIGSPIDIIGEDFSKAVLSFTIVDGLNVVEFEDAEGSYCTQLICYYDEDRNVHYLATDYDEDTNVLTTEIEEFGTYFVLDVQSMFEELGLTLPTTASLASLEDEDISLMEFDDSDNNNVNDIIDESLDEEISLMSIDRDIEVASEDTQKTTLLSSVSEGGAMAQADIVFIIDSTGSMYDEINNVKNNVGYFVDALKAKGVSAGLALVEYKDIEEDGYDTTVVHKNGTSNWFYDMDAYKSAISTLTADGGGDAPESVVDALETARLLDMRASAGKMFILVTDAKYKVGNRYDIPSMAAEIVLLKNAEINCSVVTTSSCSSTYYDLYNETGGIYVNINGNFYEELMNIADMIGTEIVGDGYWIYLDGPVPVPVRLDAEPEDGSDTDTDGDGLTDAEELESTTPTGEVDLDAIITTVSRGVITDTDYGIVKTYKYKSSPIEGDTDFDGISDDEDANPRSGVFDGQMSGYYAVQDASYTFDYRYFFKENDTYNKKLAVSSLIFANTIYNEGAYTYNDASISKKSNICKLLELHGFTDCIDYSLADGFAEYGISAYNDDDISEVAIGHNSVTYNGETKEIVAVIIRGTDGSIEEWSSNFNMGNPDAWTNDYHRGFYTAEVRIMVALQMYISDKLASTDNVFWITGHSRGAAIANILAAQLVDAGEEVYSYNFATPTVAINGDFDAEKYDCINNFANTWDVITYVPLEEWGFGRFGKTYEVEIGEDASEAEWMYQTSRDEYRAVAKTLIQRAVDDIYSQCASSWSAVYDIDEDYQLIGQSKLDAISDRNILNYKIEAFWTGYKFYPSTAFVFQLIAEMVAGSEDEVTNAVYLLSELLNTKYGKMIFAYIGNTLVSDAADIVDAIVAGEGMALIGDGHAPATYYVLVEGFNKHYGGGGFR